jgi:phage FluMu protein Com
MPLRAFIDAQEILAPLVSNEEWEILKSRVGKAGAVATLPCCQSPAYLRTSSRGIKHFVHKTKTACDWQSETWQHLKTKTEIVLGCQRAGYTVSTEVSGDNWRADVLAQKSTFKIAFEVQWSRQTLEETLERQERYKTAGVRACWFFRYPLEHVSHELPLFELTLPEEIPTVTLNDTAYPVATFVEALLTRRIRFCNHLRVKQVQPLRIVFMKMPCWRCGEINHVYYVHELVTDCGLETYDRGLWSSEQDSFIPEIIAAARAFCQTPEGRHLNMGPIKERYSKTVGQKYMSFGCASCDAIFGDYFVMEARMEAAYFEGEAPAVLERDVRFMKPRTVEYPHWCFPAGGHFCC